MKNKRCAKWLLLVSISFLVSVTVNSAETDQILLKKSHWADKTVENVSSYLGDGISWFDDFFEDERYLDETQAEILLRMQNDFLYDQSDGGLDFKTRIRARTILPRFNRKLKLTLSYDDESLFTGIENQDSLQTNDRDERNNIGLRYDLTDSLLEHLSLSANVRINPIELVLKIRHRGSWELDDGLLGRLTTTGYWNTKEGFGAKFQQDLEKELNDTKLLRWTNRGEWSEEYQSDGVKWSSVITQYRKLSPKKAVSYAAGVSGHTRPDLKLDNYFIRMRYRQNIFRSWLFVEVAPEIHWPRDESKQRCKTCFVFLTRFEVVFQKGKTPGF